ncbi:MAG: putative lipid II flippase FtsW [Bdellovibrionales bacterium]|nr:putative lipid II flippase FtsW [Bdellovibrionales bacterium]
MEGYLNRENANKDSRRKPLPFFSDKFILVIAFVLVFFSLLMIYSATGNVSQEKYGDAYLFVRRQSLAAILGFVLLFSVSYINVEWLRKVALGFFVLAVLLLLLVCIPGIGSKAGGAQRWIGVGPLHFQPSELCKIFVVISLAGFLSRREGKLKYFVPGVVVPVAFLSVAAVLLLIQPDFGSVAVLFSVALCMMLASGVRFRHFLYSGFACMVAGGILIATSPYRMKRILSFMNPWDDSQGKGYQLIQSLIAVGSGKATGVGLGASQQKLFFLPAAHTDFIFAVIAEELGFIGAVALLILFMLLLWRGLLLAGRLADDTFLFNLALGLTLLLVVPALLNIGVVIGLLPTKGLALPLISYGGSSLICSLLTVGLLLAVGRTLYQRMR